MKRLLWLALAVAASLATLLAAELAAAQPQKDPLDIIQAGQTGGATTPASGTGTTSPGTTTGTTAGTTTSAATTSAAATSVSPSGDSTGAQAERARQAMWSSPDMKIARESVLEYGRRSTQFNELAAQHYLSRVSQMSAEQMQRWLDDFKARRANSSRSLDVSKAARQTALAQSLDRIEAVQQSYQNVNQNQTAGAQFARDQFAGQQTLAQDSAAGKVSKRDYWFANSGAMDYSWIVYPSLYTQQAASASLPGDLPRGDPNNFLKGDFPAAPIAPPTGAGNAGGGAAGAAGNAAGAAAAAAANAGGS